MLGTFHYHGLLRKYIAVFGTLFNDVTVKRIDNSGNVKETMKVPLAYGPKQKFLTRITQDPNNERGVAVQVPRIGFEMTSMDYDAERKLNSLNTRVAGHNGEIGKVYSPVPYNLTFNVAVFVKNAIDGAMIIEQILPAFKPDFTVTINALPTMGIKIDMPIILNGVSVEDSYEGDFTQRRSIIYTLDFTTKVYFYPNIQGRGFGDYSDGTSLNVIRTAITNFHILSNEQSASLSSSLLLESSTESNLNYILVQNESTSAQETDRIVLEDDDSNLSESKVISSIKDSISGNIDIDSNYISFVNDSQFYEGGKDFDPFTGNYN